MQSGVIWYRPFHVTRMAHGTGHFVQAMFRANWCHQKDRVSEAQFAQEEVAMAQGYYVKSYFPDPNGPGS
jgi:hypothetical protein